jgi:hypothetical protein
MFFFTILIMVLQISEEMNWGSLENAYLDNFDNEISNKFEKV